MSTPVFIHESRWFEDDVDGHFAPDVSTISVDAHRKAISDAYHGRHTHQVEPHKEHTLVALSQSQPH
eukprot:553071-Karenia_brevis.AAC.1